MPDAASPTPSLFRRVFRCRWSLSSAAVIGLLAVYFTAFLNLSFWKKVWALVDPADTAMYPAWAALPLLLTALFYVVFSLLLWPRVGKPLLMGLLVATAAANHFAYRLGVQYDVDMMRNIYETNFHESVETIGSDVVFWTVLTGVLPALLLGFTRVRYAPPRREVLRRLSVVVGVLVLVALSLKLYLYKPYALINHPQENRHVGKSILPEAFITSTIRYVKKKFGRPPGPVMVLDPDARLAALPDDGAPTVLLLVVGETARAMNFSLNGYARETNPRLAREDVISFGNVTSSGTSTAFSLPCMFSHLPRAAFTIDKGQRYENLLDLLVRAGYVVRWRENNTGHKGVPARLGPENIDVPGELVPGDGDGDGPFHDEVLLEGLDDYLATVEGRVVVVLHMLGSHGPTYYKRYPPAFKVFTPACEDADLHRARREEIVNTYDNTLLYTDHVLAEAIALLKKHPRLASTMLYISDHGESLGENGFYLHSTNYLIAPKEQTHVPMILWMSERMRRQDYIDFAKLRAESARPWSHDHLFHSLLSLMEVDTTAYDPALDLFADYRTAGHAEARAEAVRRARAASATNPDVRPSSPEDGPGTGADPQATERAEP